MKIATIVQIVGSLTLSVGVGLVFIPAGLVVAGVLAVLFGIAMEKNSAE
jgi:uncharacterized membrane protein